MKVYHVSEHQLHVGRTAQMVVFGRKAVAPLGSKDLVTLSADQALPDMYPISPLIDLTERQMKKETVHGCMYNIFINLLNFTLL